MNYIEMNREERYFCFLLGHALLKSNMFREEFCKKVKFSPEDFEIYPEAAWLRDYWSSCGFEKDGSNKRIKLSDGCRHANRKACLNKIFCDIDLEKIFTQIMDKKTELHDLSRFKSFEEDFFWSKGVSGEGELVYPGRWPLEKLDNYDCREQLIRLKWAFNAKPDLMLVSGRRSTLLEVKVESKEDKYSYDGKSKITAKQTDVQKLVGTLMSGLSGRFVLPQHCFLAKNLSKVIKEEDHMEHVLWKEVVEITKKVSDIAEKECDKLDDFTLRGFSESLIIRS